MIKWVISWHRWVSAKLWRQAAVSAFSITFVLLLLLGSVSFVITRQMMLESINQQLVHEAGIVAQRLELELSQIADAGRNLAANTLVSNGLVDSAGRKTYLAPFLRSHSFSQVVKVKTMLTDFSGQIIASNSGQPGTFRQAWFAESMRKNRPWAEMTDGGGSPQLLIAWPVVYPATKQPEGMLILQLFPRELLATTGTPAEKAFVKELKDNAGHLLKSHSTNPGELISIGKPIQLAPPLDRLGFRVVVGLVKAQATSAMNKLVLYYSLAGLLAIFVTTGLSVFASRRLSAPLAGLSQVARQVSQSGRLNFPIAARRDDEVGILARVFAEMLSKLSLRQDEMEALIAERTAGLAESESRMRAVLETAVEGIITIDSTGLMESVNPAAEKIFGYGPGGLVGRNVTCLMPEPHKSQHHTYLENYLRTGERHVIGMDREVLGLRKDGSLVPLDLSVSKIQLGSKLCFTGILRDITQRQRQEAEIKRLSLVATRTDNAVVITDARGSIQWVNDSFSRIFKSSLPEVEGRPTWEPLHGTEKDAPTIDWMTEQMAAGRGFDTEIHYRDRDGRQYWLAVEARPISNEQGEISNFIILKKDITERRQAEESLRQVREREVSIGARIQQALLLGAPPRDLPGINVEAFSLASQRIDGDFYDFIPLGDRVMDLVVGDVMGKGIPAALVGAATKNHFARAFVELRSPREIEHPQPWEVLTQVHNRVTKDLISLESFATLCYARFDLENRTLTYVDCGHTGIVQYSRGDDAVSVLKGENMPLGFSLREDYHETSVPIGSGDIFLFYSDGVTEARDPDDELFGEERLLDLVYQYRDLDSMELLRALYRSVREFIGDLPLSDDLTMVALKVSLEEEGGHRAVREEREFRSSLSALTAMREFVNEFWAASDPLPGEEGGLAGFVLAVNEAASNVVRHAYQGKEDQPIWITLSADPKGIEARISHLGLGFDRKDVEPPAFDGSREGGFGLYLIDQIVDDHQYLRDDRGRQCIRLAKWRKEHSQDGITG